LGAYGGQTAGKEEYLTKLLDSDYQMPHNLWLTSADTTISEGGDRSTVVS
jgi:hypothetical protein